MIFFCAILFVMTFFPTIVICGLASGNLHLKVSPQVQRANPELQILGFKPDDNFRSSSTPDSTQIRNAYQPLTKLLANTKLKFPTTIRIVRILDFINSEYSGANLKISIEMV